LTGSTKRIVLTGCGAVAEHFYAPAIGRLVAEGVVDDVLLIDRAENRIGALRRILPHASAYTDLAEVLPQLDESLVVIALPHNLHASQSIKALESGAHVLCEKPMAVTVEECDLMLAAAARSSRLLAVGHIRRFFPVSKVIREWIIGERLGRLRAFRFLEGEPFSWPVTTDSFFRRETSGGGVLIDAGAHTLDLLLWWLGPVAELDYSDDAVSGVEANCVIRIKTQNGASGLVQMSREIPLANQYLFEFERGWLLYKCGVVHKFSWGWLGETVTYATTIESSLEIGFDRLPKSAPVSSSMVSCFEMQLSNMLRAIQGREPAMCAGPEARQTVALIERCYRERHFLPQPWLPEKEQSKLDSLQRLRVS